MTISRKTKSLYFANSEQSEHGPWFRNLPRQAAAKKNYLKKTDETLKNFL